MADTDLQHIDTTPGKMTLVNAAPEVGEMFYTLAAFEAAQRMAIALSKANMLPPTYHNNPANCMVLISVAHAFRHMGVTPFMVAQQLVPVNGKFGWQGQFVAAVVNASNRFNGDLQYEFTGKDDEYGCAAWTTRKDGTVIKGTKITMQMVKDEGWYGKNGSKWKTMPEQMFRYRAASFFGKAYTPDLLQGFQTAEELDDMKDVTPTKGEEMTKTILGDTKPQVTPEPVVAGVGLAPIKIEGGIFPQSVEDHLLTRQPGYVESVERKVKLGEVGKLRKDSVVDDVDDQIPF